MKKNSCAACGNNPVPHGLNWYFESLNIFLTPLRQALFYNPFSRRLVRAGISQPAAKFFLAAGEFLGIVRRQADPGKCRVRRAQVLWEDGKKRGIKMEELLLFGKPFDCYTASKEGKTIVFSGLPRPPRYYNSQLDVMDDKWWLKEKFSAAGLPVPLGQSCWNFRQAKKIFLKIQAAGGGAVIVKPRAGSRGRHSTTFVRSLPELKRAFKLAKQLCFWAIVEEQLAGPVYRATVIDFQLAGVLRGDPPQVAGDGSHSIRELLALKNELRPSGVKEIAPGAGTENFLRRQNLSLDSIIPAGQAVSLSEKIGVNYGGSSSEDFEICHEDNKQLFVRAAKLLGDPIAGFDFIIPDIARSYKEQKCGFIEVNTLPFINLHHDPLLGNPRNVAAKVWEMMGM